MGGELWFACEGTGVSTGGRAHRLLTFLQCGHVVHDVCTSFLNDDAWICARRTADCDLESQRCEKVECLDMCTTDNRP